MTRRVGPARRSRGSVWRVDVQLTVTAMPTPGSSAARAVAVSGYSRLSAGTTSPRDSGPARPHAANYVSNRHGPTRVSSQHESERCWRNGSANACRLVMRRLRRTRRLRRRSQRASCADVSDGSIRAGLRGPIHARLGRSRQASGRAGDTPSSVSSATDVRADAARPQQHDATYG